MKTIARILPVFVFGLMLAPSAFAAPVERDLALGMRGNDIVTLQTFLIAENAGVSAQALAKVGATGNFGALTRAAVIEFQKAKGIAPAHGYVGPKTRAAMSVKPLAAPTFSGTLEDIDTACFADGVCSATVAGKKVTLMAGLRIPPIPPLGRIIGADSIGDLEGMIGASVDVYAATTTEGGSDYTLYGDTKYYLKVTPTVPQNGDITVRGTVSCLPPKDGLDAVIAMCAFGLKATDGNYYQLSDKDGDLGANGFSSEAIVEVKGTFAKGEHSTWKSVGTIEVKSLREGA